MGGALRFQSSFSIGSRIMPLGNAVGKKGSRGVEKKERSRFGGGKKEAFLRLHSLVTRMLSWMWQSAPGEARSAERQ